MKEEWNPNDYQGRSKKQVENQYFIFSIVLGVTSVICTLLMLYTIFNNMF